MSDCSLLTSAEVLWDCPYCPKLPGDRMQEQASQTGTPLFVKYVQIGGYFSYWDLQLQTCTSFCTTSNNLNFFSHLSTPQHSLSSTNFPSLETIASRLSTNSRFRTQTAKLRSQPTSLQWLPQEKNALFSENQCKEWRRLSSRRSTLAQWSIKLHFQVLGLNVYLLYQFLQYLFDFWRVWI